MTTAAIVANGKKAENPNTAVNSITATFPSSHTATAGNLLLAFVYISGFPASRTPITPTGWTEHLTYPAPANTDKRLTAYVKAATGGETGITAAFTGTASAMGAHVFEIADCDAAGIVAGTTNIFADGNEVTSGAATSSTSDSINPTSTDDVLFLYCVALNTTVGALSWTSSFVTETTDTLRSFVGSRTVNNPGATSTVATYTNAGAAIGIVLAIPTLVVANTAPTADAGANQGAVVIGTAVALDGTNSFDAETAAIDLTYEWTILDDGGTGLLDADIADVNDPTTTIDTTGAAAGTATVQLTVTDDDGSPLDDTDTMTVTLVAVPAGSINGWIWDGATDTWLALS